MQFEGISCCHSKEAWNRWKPGEYLLPLSGQAQELSSEVVLATINNHHGARESGPVWRLPHLVCGSFRLKVYQHYSCVPMILITLSGRCVCHHILYCCMYLCVCVPHGWVASFHENTHPRRVSTRSRTTTCVCVCSKRHSCHTGCVAQKRCIVLWEAGGAIFETC